MRVFSVFLLFCIFIPVLVAAPLKLKIVNGPVLEGSIFKVENKEVYVQLQSGGAQRVALKHMDSNARIQVNQWVKKRGGTLQYTSRIGTLDKYFSKQWPRSVHGPGKINLKKRHDLERKGLWVYDTEHFRFHLNTKVHYRVVERFAMLFEATHKLVLALPVNASARYYDNEDKLPIYLFGDMNSYYRAGGVRGTAGVYIPRSGSVLVPLDVLGVRWSGKEWTYQFGESNKVLVHELTHQLTAGVEFAAWYIEGSAEYVAAAKYVEGSYNATYDLKSHEQRVFEYATKKGGLDGGFGRELGNTINMPNLEAFMTMPYREFAGAEANRNYGAGLLLTQFLYHKEGQRSGRAIKKYIQAKQRGKSEAEALKLLMGQRSFSQLQTDFQRYCASKGVKLIFT